MTSFKKETFDIAMRGGKFEKRDGYTFERELPNGELHRFGVHKEDELWKVTDITSGYCLTFDKYEMRQKAADSLTDKILDQFVELMKTDGYRDICKALIGDEPLLQTMRRTFAKVANIAVTQKREDAPVWVTGETKPIAETLKEMGFKWSRKRMAWYLKVA